MNPQTFHDLAVFARHLIGTRDIDPLYPLLGTVAKSERLDPEQAHWLVYTYLCFYNSGSAWAVFTRFPDPAQVRTERNQLFVFELEHRHRGLVINVERRGLRGGRVVEALTRFADQLNGQPLLEWLTTGLGADPYANYEVLWDRLQTVPYVGRWAAFKWLDLLEHVAMLPVAAPDMRMQFSSGPRHALEKLYLGTTSDRQDPAYIAYLNDVGCNLREWLHQRGLTLAWDELETVLCNFHSLAAGRYYVGHDLDEHLRDTRRAAAVGDMAPWYAARQRLFDPAVLGEVGGWDDVRRDLCTQYQRTGVVYTPTVARLYAPGAWWRV